MARRNQFKGIAGNLTKWVISRNFDADGYWAVGKICKYAESEKLREVSFKLIGNNESREFCISLERAREELYKYIKYCKMPEYWLFEAEIKFEFNAPPNPRYHYWGSALGNPFICTVSITTDLGRIFTNKSGSFCRPHNPEKEQRRYGF